MTGDPLLDWASMTVSLFNTILLLWLGLTVLLNAERRTWGIWAAGGGLLMGGAFFISHTALLGHGLATVSWAMDLWWRLGWGPVIALPFAWYVVTLWYAGYWDAPAGALRRRQRPALAVATALALGFAALLVFADPLPSYAQLARLDLAAAPAYRGVPLLIIAYPFYSMLCIALSLDALRHPTPAARVMGDLARQRARPWVAAAAGALLLVSLLVAGAMAALLVDGTTARRLAADTTLGAVAAFDLLVATLIAAAVVLLGQAVVSYEIFTGKTLPRGGLRRHWRSAIILAAGYSAVVAASLIRGWQPISGILLATLFMTAFYALFSWRSYAERDRYMEQLRPFVASQGLYADLLAPASAPAVDAAGPFRALCADVLGARVAHLAAVGPLAPLVGAPLAYPPDAASPLPVLAEIAGACRSPQTLCVGVDPAAAGGARWAVPLWSERGLIGVLLLGDKRDGGLYTQEEIEIARASGERLIDTQASAALAGRLMALQRQRLAESSVLDRQARRALHDDVLPLLHTAMLSLSGTGSAEGLALLADAHRRISDLLREMPSGAAPAVARLGLVAALRQAVDDEWAGAFDSVTWDVAPAGAAAAAALPPLAAEVLFYAAREAIRNAARYGRATEGARPLRLRIAVTASSGLEITIEDDGVGLATPPAAPAGGSGQGLALHSTLLAVVGGTLAVESAPDRYTRVALALPAAALVAA